MDRQALGVLRWGRAAVLAAVALASGTVAHLSADGLVPGPGSLLVLYLLCVAAAAAALGRPAGTTRVVVLVMAGQTVIHGALTSLAGHRGDPVAAARAPLPAPPALSSTALSSTDGRRTGSLYDQAYAGRPSGTAELTLPAPVQHLLADLTGPHALMALAHLAAAAVLGWWLARGEHLLWSLLALTAAGVTDATRRGLRLADLVTVVAAVAARVRADLHRLARTRPAGPPVTSPGRGRLVGGPLLRRGPPAPGCA